MGKTRSGAPTAHHARESRRLSTLLEVSQALSGTLNLRAALHRVLERTDRALADSTTRRTLARLDTVSASFDALARQATSASARLDTMLANVNAGRARLHSTEQSVFLNTISAYMNVVRDEAVLKLNEANVQLLKKQLEAAQARFDVGEITRTDVAQAEARLAAGQASETSAQAQLKASRLSYERAVGEAPGVLDPKPGVPAVPETEVQAREIANVHGIVLVIDEIQTGFARTGRMFAIEHSGVEPDLMTMAKSLAGGFPLAAVVGKAPIMDAPAPGGLGGVLVARLFGEEPEQQVAGDLRRFKQLMETGEIATTEGQPSGRRGIAARLAAATGSPR